MTQGDLLSIGKEAILTALTISAPFLLASLAIGIVVSVFQAATQIHEQNIVFVPKIISSALVLIFLGSWIIGALINFTQNVFYCINAMA